MIPDNTTIALSIVFLAALVHASFQLSISVLTLMSGHALGRKTAHRRLVHLIGGFVSGAIVMTVFLLTFIAYLAGVIMPFGTPAILWAISSGLAIGVGIAVWLFYYRRQLGTILWIPRSFARYLDVDGDGQGNACDADNDNDTIANDVDNCPFESNVDQLNADLDADVELGRVDVVRGQGAHRR